MGIAVAGLIATGLSTAMGAVGAISSAEAQSQAASYQAQIARNNAQLATENAHWATESGETQAAQQQMKTRAEVGSIEAAQAANGLDVNSGSAVDVRSSANSLGNLDALTIRSNAARQAYGYQVQNTNDIAEAQLDEAQAQSAMTAGTIGAFGSLLGGAGSLAGGWTRLQAVGY